MSDEDIATYVDMWLSLKPYINPKDKEIACEKFLAVIDENVCDLTEVCDEWFGNDSTLDRVLRDVYYEDEYDNLDEDSMNMMIVRAGLLKLELISNIIPAIEHYEQLDEVPVEVDLQCKNIVEICLVLLNTVLTNYKK